MSNESKGPLGCLGYIGDEQKPVTRWEEVGNY